MRAELQPTPSTPPPIESISDEPSPLPQTDDVAKDEPSPPPQTDDVAKDEYNSQAEESKSSSPSTESAESADLPSLPESVSSDSSSASVVELSDDMTSEPTVTPEPINVTAQTLQTKVRSEHAQ